MQKIVRTSAGVMLESDVLAYLDHLAREQQRSRSFLINAILRWYVRCQTEQSKVEVERKIPVIRL